MSILLSNLIAKVNHSQLASLNGVLTDILNIVHNPNANAWQLKQAIEMDSALTARVLQRANSAFYGLPRQVRRVFDAIICMGFDTIRELAVEQKIYELFQPAVRASEFSSLGLWVHSLSVATCGKLIYQRILRRHGEEMYTVGLLHDVGILVEAQFLPDLFARILRRSDEDKIPLQQAEQELLGYTHADISQRLGEAWNFPIEFCQIMSIDDQPLATGWHTDKMAMVLLVANTACRDRGLGYTELSEISAELYRDCMKQLKLSECALNLIMDEVEHSISIMIQGGCFSSLSAHESPQERAIA